VFSITGTDIVFLDVKTSSGTVSAQSGKLLERGMKMKRGFKPFMPLLAAAALCGTVANVPSASAVTIDINTCWTECNAPALPNVTVATLAFNNTVANTVQFTLTNTQSNLGAVSGSGAFISQLLFNYTGSSALTFTKIDFSDVSNEGSFAQGSLTNAGLSFNLDLRGGSA
jgi:hypothetical protein